MFYSASCCVPAPTKVPLTIQSPVVAPETLGRPPEAWRRLSFCSLVFGFVKRAAFPSQRCLSPGRSLPRSRHLRQAEPSRSLSSSDADWRGSRVASGRTHHMGRGEDGSPLYPGRFDEVLPFHEPGLAPVQLEGRAWHIDASGEAAYTRRFSRVFGFYEGRASVIGLDGRAWHIRTDGQDLYEERYEWCGNYQGGRCAVRSSVDGRYLHLDEHGSPISSSARWRYAGDFREGAAVVHDSSGRATHIDRDGDLVHGCWFLDLDVFHKGYACARDARGWMHIDRAGVELYGRRFRRVEPFYNGQARVHRSNAGVEVIDESGASVCEVLSARCERDDEFVSLSSDLVGFWRTQTLSAAVELGIFEALPATLPALGLQLNLPEGRLRRLLRALGELNTVECFGSLWRATEKGSILALQHPTSLASAALEYGGVMTRSWKDLPNLLLGPEDRAPAIFREAAADAGRIEGFHCTLESYAKHDYEAVAETLQLRGDEVVLDAGGGTGTLATMLLAHYAQLQVILCDLPEVVAQHKVPGILAERLIVHGADLEGDWAKDIPEGSVDAVIFARVLHDFNDSKAVELLRQAHAVLKPSGRLFIIEFLLPEESFNGGLCDLHLLAVTGGQERRLVDLKALLSQEGIFVQEVRRLPTLPSVVVAAITPPNYGEEEQV